MNRFEDNAPGYALFLGLVVVTNHFGVYSHSSFSFSLVTTYFPGTNMGRSRSCIVEMLMDVMDI